MLGRPRAAGSRHRRRVLLRPVRLFAVDDTDAIAARCTELGGTILSPPTDAGPIRVATLRDPHGTTFTASHYKG